MVVSIVKSNENTYSKGRAERMT